MLSSIRGKILSILLVLALVGVGTATWLHIESSLNSRQSELQERAKDIGGFIGLTFMNQLLKDSPTTREKRKQLEVWMDNKPHINFFSVYNTNGIQIFSYRSNASKLPSSERLTPNFLRKIMASNQQTVAREIDDLRTYEFLVPIRLFEINFGLIRIGFDGKRFYSDRTRIIRRNAIFGFLLIILVSGIGWLVTGYLVRPIKHLEAVARDFGLGNYSLRADVKSGDEIQRLGDQFNMMASQIQQQIDDLKTIEELNRKISARLRPEKLYDHIVNLIKTTWDIPYVALILQDPQTDELNIASGFNVAKKMPSQPDNIAVSLSRLEDVSQKTMDENESNSPENLKDEDLNQLETIFTIDRQATLTDALVLRMEHEERSIGYLVLCHSSKQFERSEFNLLQTLTHQIKIAVQNAKNYQRAVTDDLTELYNRGFFEMELENEIEGANQTEKPLSLAMIDIDDFKEYNDTYGHPAGDQVLKRVTSVFQDEIRTSDIREAARENDTLARYGGEEFSIIFPSTELDGARAVGERIVHNVAKLDEFEEQITISMGIAEYRSGDTKEEFIERADSALYEAKKNGKNQVYTDG